MRLYIRFLSFMSFLGSVYWIYRNHHEVEPYVTCFGCLAGFLGTFVGIPKANVVASLIRKEKRQFFRLQNIGEADAKDVQITFHHFEPFHPRDLKLFPQFLAPGQEFEILIALDYSTGSILKVSCSWVEGSSGLRTTRMQNVILV